MTTTGWTRVRLGDVGRQVSEHEHDPVSVGLERYVGLEHLDPEHITVERWGDIADGTTFTKRFRAGQLLFAKRRAYQRKAAVADFDGICSGDLIVIEAKPDVLLPELVPYIVHTDRFLDHALRTSSGSLSPRTKWKDLAGYEFDLPPLDRQHEVLVAMEGLDAVLLKAVVAEETAQRLFASKILDEMSGLAGREWGTTKLGEVAEVRLGLQLSPARRTGANPLPYLRAANVRQSRIVTDDVLRMDFSEDEWMRYELQANDILLVEGGEARDVGMSVLVSKEHASQFGIQNTLIRIRAGAGLDARFLYYAVYGLRLSGVFSRMARGTKIKHIGSGRVAELEIPNPPAAVAMDVSTRLEGAEHLQRTLAVHIGYVRDLRRRVLADLLGGAA